MFFSSVSLPKPRPRGSLIAALDAGSHKVCCLIARVGETGKPNVIGIGHHLSQGIKHGVVVDIDAAASAIGHAVHAAEQMAGENITEVITTVSGSHLQSFIHKSTLTLSGEVSDAHTQKALNLARQEVAKHEQLKLIQAIPVDYTLDGQAGVVDPRGLHGGQLQTSVHLVTANANAVKNLAACVQRKHLDIAGLVAAPYAAGLSALVDDELELGAVVIDMGGGTTNIGVFSAGHLVFADCIPIGGQHITTDIARGLTTPMAQAERMKTLYGSAIATASDDREIIDVPQVGEEDASASNHVPRSLLVGIIQPRVEEILELVRERLEASGQFQSTSRRVVLTGGASQLQGLRDLAQAMLERQVRHGKPMHVSGLAESTGGPAFAVAAGLLLSPFQSASGGEITLGNHSSGNLMSQVKAWLRDNL
jgi:cell division protein FtsA